MQIRDFTGADLEPASKLVGHSMFSSEKERSYWFGSYELMGALAAGDAALVAEAEGELLAVCVLRGAADAASGDLRMHWTQQRHVLLAVTRTLGIDLASARPEETGAQAQAFLSSLGAAQDNVCLVCATKGADDALWARLARKTRDWLVSHGVDIDETQEATWSIREGVSTDEQAVIAIIDEAAERHGHPFRTIGYTVEVKGEVAGGLCGWISGRDLHVDSLGVREDLRGQGIGTRLLECAERKAKELGCTTASIDTFTFQAPDYYPMHGYEEIFRYPTEEGAERIYFAKRLV